MQQDSMDNIDLLGRKLSLLLDCTIRMPANGNNILVCNHNVAFSIQRLRGSADWSWARKHHKDKEVK